MVYSREYFFTLDGIAKIGVMSASDNYSPIDPADIISAFQDCDKSRIGNVALIPPEATGDKSISEKCVVHISRHNTDVEITINDWKDTKKVLFQFCGKVGAHHA